MADVEAIGSALAAALPSDPWNCVALDPHPTLMNLSSRVSSLMQSGQNVHTLAKILCP